MRESANQPSCSTARHTQRTMSAQWGRTYEWMGQEMGASWALIAGFAVMTAIAAGFG